MFMKVSREEKVKWPMYNIGKKLNNTMYMEENILIENICYLKILVNNF